MWDQPGQAEAEAAAHEISILSDEERTAWVKTLQPMMASYIQIVKDQGVGNAGEIYQAMKDKVFEYEQAHQ